jgi:putative transposase
VIRLMPCFTPVRSSESNGIAKAVVTTFKRDYVRINPKTRRGRRHGRARFLVRHYDEMHPHRALAIRSPRQFLQAHQPAACAV